MCSRVERHKEESMREERAKRLVLGGRWAYGLKRHLSWDLDFGLEHHLLGDGGSSSFLLC